MDVTRRLRLPALLVGLSLALAAGCGEQESRLVNSNVDDEPTTPMDLGDEYIAQQTNVIMPWTHTLTDEVVDLAQIEPDKLVFPNSGPAAEVVGDFERGDVLVSAKADMPFLRKVLSVERTDTEIIFHTRRAKLVEAVYKGQMTEQPYTPADADGVRRQELGASEAPRVRADQINIGVTDNKLDGVPGLQTSGGKLIYTADNGLSVSAQPELQINASFYFDLKIEPASNMNTSYTTFTGTKTCYSGNDCFPNAARGENRGVSCVANRCTYESTEYDGFWFDAAGPSCNDIIGALDYADQNASCQADFDAYYAGNRTLSQVKSGPCGDYLPPHPVQVDWAKDNCSGALKRMVVDAEGSMTPTTGPIKVGFQPSGQKTFKLWETRDKRLMSRLFFIGYLPVYITANAKATLSFEVSASAEAVVELSPIEIGGLQYGTGFHYYGSSSENDNLGVRMPNGSIEPFWDGVTGDFSPNPVREPNVEVRGLDFETQDLTVRASGKASAKLWLAPRIDLLLYDQAGPYLEPFSPYGSVQFDAGGVFSVRDGGSSTSACNDNPASLCGRVGIESKVGITAENLCGEGQCNWSTTINDTCSDYCPANQELLCYKHCMGDEAPKPIEVELSWDNEQVDLDLAMIQPEYIDYRNDSFTARSDYRHGGDECPDHFNGCYSIKNGQGKYTETIEMSETGTAPPSGTRMVFEVENFKSEGDDTFDLIVKQDGQVIKEWKDQSAGQEDEKHELDFTMP